MSFESVRDRVFPNAVPQDAGLRALNTRLAELGFTPANTLASVGTCRDELTRDLRRDIQNHWGEAFDLSGLGGLLSLGRTGFAAAHLHAPLVDGRARYLYLVTTHIGIGADGTLGECTRPGRPSPSTACGALMALHGELEGDCLRLRHDPLDAEQSLLKARLMEVLPHDHRPDLAEITHAAHDVVRADLQAMVAELIDPATDCYALCTGVQIHGPGQQTWLWRGSGVAVVEGTPHALPGWP